MGRNRALVSVVLLAGMIAGCGTSMPDLSIGNPMDRWFGKHEPDTPQTMSGVPYVEPRPGQPTGLRVTWRNSLASDPGDEMIHPQGFVADGEALYVASFDGGVFRVERGSGREVWKVKFKTRMRGGPAVAGDTVYLGTGDGEVLSLARQDGHVQWRERVPTSVVASPVVANKLVIVRTVDNQTHALDAAAGVRIWKHATLPQALSMMGAASPTVAGGVVYAGYSTGELYALDVESGRQLWGQSLTVLSGRSELDLLQDVDAAVLVGGGMAFAANHQGQLMALEPGTGRTLWKRNMSVLRTPLLVGERLFVSDMDGNVAAIHARDGERLWRTQVSDGVLTAPVFYGGQIVVADSKGRLATLDADSGKVTGLDKQGEPVFADPLVSAGDLFLWTNKGSLYRYN